MAFLEDEPAQWHAFVISGSAFFLGILFYTIYQPLRQALGIYTLLALLTTIIYGAGSIFGNVLIGIRLKKLGDQFLLGLVLAAAFILLKILIPAFAVGTPSVPGEVTKFVTGMLLLFFAPTVEELVCRGALLMWVQFVESKNGEITPIKFWTANIIQSLFFATWHLAAYIAGWYSLTGWALASNIVAQSSAFIAAFTFGLAAGWLDTRPNVRSLIPGMVAHLVINTTVFISLSVVGTPFAIALPLSFTPSIGFMSFIAIKRNIFKDKKLINNNMNPIRKIFGLLGIEKTVRPFNWSSVYTQTGGYKTAFSPNDEENISEGDKINYLDDLE